MNNTEITPQDRASWQVPAFDIPLWQGQRHRWCVVIPVINEGERIGQLLDRMQALEITNLADILISLSEVAGSPDDAPDTLCLIFHNRMIFISLLMQ
jgi:hypothetical protein